MFMVGVIVNTNSGNAAMMTKIVNAYNSGTVVPDEIAINITDITDNISLGSFLDLKEMNPNVFLYANRIFDTDAHFRKKSLTLVSSDIILYQTDNAIPHRQRVEIIKDLFDNNDIVAVSHPTSVNASSVLEINHIQRIESDILFRRYFPHNNKFNAIQYTRHFGLEFNIKTDMANICIRRDVLNRIHWKDDFEVELYPKQDCFGAYYDFCLETLYTYNKSMVIDAPLTIVNK